MFWPFVQFINFTFIPTPYRVMYINMLTCLYNVWLSIVKHNDEIGTMITIPSTTTKPSPTLAANEQPNDDASPSSPISRKKQ